MIAHSVKFRGRRVRLAGFGPSKYQMFALASAGVKSVKERVSRGIGIDDAPMKPLRVRNKGRRFSKSQNKVVEFEYGHGYLARKRAAGLKPIRDLYGFGIGGHMLDAFRVTYADPTQARADITTRLARVKARANEARAPWFGLSGRDVANLATVSRKIFGSIVAGIRIGARAGRVPVWLDPLGIAGNEEYFKSFSGSGSRSVESAPGFVARALRRPAVVAAARRKTEAFKAGQSASRGSRGRVRAA